MIRQAFGEESMRLTREVQTHRDRVEARQMKSKVKSMLIMFFDIKGVVHKEFVMAGLTVSSAYYYDVLRRLRENLRRLRRELWR
jgi:hypothetical protein